MTDLLTTPPSSAPTAPHRRRTVIVVVSVVAVALLVIAWRWHAGTVELLPYPAGGASAQAVPGTTVYLDSGIYPATDAEGAPASLPLDVADVVPQIESNSAQADVVVLVCTRRAGTDGIGSVSASTLPTACSSVTPFTGRQRIDLGFQTAQVIVALTLHRSGEVHITGLDVTLADGPWRVTQHAGSELTMTSP